MYTQNTFKRDEKYIQAKEQVEKLKGFYIHLSIYLIFIPIFIFINIFSGGNFPWAIFPIAGWGLGVIGHATEVYNWNPFFSKDWEERKIKDIMNNQF